MCVDFCGMDRKCGIISKISGKKRIPIDEFFDFCVYAVCVF